jgi:hypothetical protein
MPVLSGGDDRSAGVQKFIFEKNIGVNFSFAFSSLLIIPVLQYSITPKNHSAIHKD